MKNITLLIALLLCGCTAKSDIKSAACSKSDFAAYDGYWRNDHLSIFVFVHGGKTYFYSLCKSNDIQNTFHGVVTNCTENSLVVRSGNIDYKLNLFLGGDHLTLATGIYSTQVLKKADISKNESDYFKNNCIKHVQTRTSSKNTN